MPDTDCCLIRRAIAGERCALAELVQRWDRPVFSVALRCLGDWNEALDVRQQTFERVVRRLESFDPEGTFAPWLYRIVVNLCRDRRRADRTRRRSLGNLRSLTTGAAVDDLPSERTSQDELSAVVRDAVSALPADEREVIVLRHYAGLSFSEAAAALDLPASTLKSRSQRALQRLRTRFRKLNLIGDEDGAES